MKTTFRSMTLPLFALVAALAGCSAGTASSAAAETVGDVHSAAASAQATARDERHGDRPDGMHAHGGHGRPDFLVRAALHAPINLTAEQRTKIEALAKAHEQKPAFDTARAAKLAAAIRSNTVSATEEPNADAHEAHMAAAAAALTTLHDTLTAEQRAALIDDLAKRNAERSANRGEHGAKGDGKGEHGEHGQRGEHAGRGFGGPMHMLADLDLTQEQKDAIKAKLDAARPAQPTEEQRAAMKARFEAMHTERQAKLESFKGATFDAKAFVTPPARPALNDAKRVNPLAVITSVLTPAQREKLAARIEQGPQAKAPQ